MPDLDQTGDQLLKHARVYTLADKFGMDKLKTLAHSKSTSHHEDERLGSSFTDIDHSSLRQFQRKG